MSQHISVLMHEAVAALNVQPHHWYIDGTFGRGGHTSEILNQGGQVIAFDWDQEAIEFGLHKFQTEIAQGKLILIRESFEKLSDVISQLKIENLKISGALFDFGTSTEQLMSSHRGFSFQGVGDLDMRMDDRLGVKAKDLLMVLSEKQLSEMFFEFGGESEARKIAKAIVQARHDQDYDQLQTTQGLRELITNVKREKRGHLHPATKVFQALRIAVNGELQAIELALPQAIQILEKNGKIVTIAFHEGEDRIVKKMFKKWEEQGLGKNETKQPVTPSDQEINDNTRSRSAKLRVFTKC